jgi:uncharacterized protein YchJ
VRCHRYHRRRQRPNNWEERMKKKSAAKVIEELDYALIQIVAACETFKDSPTCPEHIKPWFDHIEARAKQGMEQSK